MFGVDCRGILRREFVAVAVSRGSDLPIDPGKLVCSERSVHGAPIQVSNAGPRDPSKQVVDRSWERRRRSDLRRVEEGGRRTMLPLPGPYHPRSECPRVVTQSARTDWTGRWQPPFRQDRRSHSHRTIPDPDCNSGRSARMIARQRDRTNWWPRCPPKRTAQAMPRDEPTKGTQATTS